MQMKILAKKRSWMKITKLPQSCHSLATGPRPYEKFHARTNCGMKISKHENEISMHKNEITVHENEDFCPKYFIDENNQ